MNDTRKYKRKPAFRPMLISAQMTLPAALLSLGLTLPLALLASLPLWSGALLSGLFGLLLWISFGILLYAVWRREEKNLAILADRVDQPVEFRTTVVFRKGRRRCPGYLLLTYDDCYLVARTSGLFARVDKTQTETFVLHKSETFSIHVLSQHKAVLMPNAVEGYEISVARLKKLIYLMDRDFWRITGRRIAGYLA